MSRPDEKLLAQLRETETLLRTHLAATPDDLRALALADLVAEVHPKCTPETRAMARHFRRRRRALGAAYADAARSARLDDMFLDLWRGLRAAEFGEAAYRPLADRVCALSDRVAVLDELRIHAVREGDAALAARCRAAMKALDRDAAKGKIDASYLEGALRHGLAAEWYPNGHLRRIAFRAGAKHHGKLELDAAPGSGRFYLRGERGGYGFAHDESYRDGKLHLTFYSPWHDGAEGSEEKPWTEWVRECIGSLRQAAASGSRGR